MSYHYGIIGAGRQGIAAAYDLAVRGEASSIAFADHDEQAALRACELLDSLTDGVRLTHHYLNAADMDQATNFMAGKDAVLGSASWRLNIGLTDAAIASKTHFADLGGNSDVVWEQFKRDDDAQRADVSIVPDCGQVPGTGANLLALVASRFDVADTVVLYDGGIPQQPKEPWNYRLTFNMDGLTNEYYGHAHYILDGQLAEVEVFDPSEYELIEFDEIGTLEAFPTAGGLTTVSRTLFGKVSNLKNKTLRYPGHVCQFKAFRDAGFFDETPMDLNGQRIVPRQVFHALIEPKIRADAEFQDVIINRVVGTGEITGRRAEVTLDVLTYPPDTLPFTAMQVATGWHAGIILHQLASGQCESGVVEVERSIDGDELLGAFQARGYHVNERVQAAAS